MTHHPHHPGLPRLLLTLLGAGLCAGAGQAQQEGYADPLTTVRVYLIDRENPDPAFRDAAASLTVRMRSGVGRTFLLARVSREPEGRGGTGEAMGMIRGLVGSPGRVELFWKGGPAVSSKKRDDEPAASALPTGGIQANGQGAGTPPDPRELLHRVHQGPSFAASIPSSRLAEVASAWVTLRLGSLTWSSEEFLGPTAPEDSEHAVLADVQRTLRTLRDRASQGATFMDLRPQAEILIRALARLAPTGFLEATGTYEGERQACLALARAIEDACSFGDWGRIAPLTLQCEPRVRNLQSLWKEPDRPEIPTLDPR